MVILSPSYGGGGILIFVRIPLVSALALASNFLVCKISCETVVVFLPKFMDNKIGT